jgi:site-specific DNA-methyltransferase (adenine-specific)
LKYNVPQKMHGLDLLRSIGDGVAALVILDPQYRGVLDAMKYGNEGERHPERSALPQMSELEICRFVSQAARVLRPGGHCLFWSDKFSIGTGAHLKYFQFTTNLQIVELIAWNKARIGMGRRARCTTEYLVIAQKAPIRAKDVWTDHSIPDSWVEKKPAGHPHAKPIKLMTRLIEATSSAGDLVVDPCAGGFGVLDICLATGRLFLGCDLRGSAGHTATISPLGTEWGTPSVSASTAAASAPAALATDLLARLRGKLRPMANIPTLNAEDLNASD